MSAELDDNIWKEELEAIGARRRGLLRELGLPDQPTTAGPTEPERRQQAWERGDQEQIDALTMAHRMRPFGVAFSGGGIRSATFNLGVLQGLAEHGLLKHVDYLSTVSGGGYIGAWLHGLVANRFAGRISATERFLVPSTDGVTTPPRQDDDGGRTATRASTDEEPIAFLRKYSNYLSPRAGLFSTDAWVITSIWIRNVFLNQIILVSLLSAVMAGVLLVGLMQQQALDTTVVRLLGATGRAVGSMSPGWLTSWLTNADEAVFDLLQTITALALLGLATFITARNLREAKERSTTSATGSSGPSALYPHWTLRYGGAVAPLMFAVCFLLIRSGVDQAVVAGSSGVVKGPSSWYPLVVGLTIFMLCIVFQWGGGFVRCFIERRRDADGREPAGTRANAVVLVLIVSIVSGVVTTSLMYATWHILPMPGAAADSSAAWTRITVGPPLMALCFMTGASLMIGLMGVDYPDASREWLARAGAALSLVCAAWLGLFAVAVYVPLWVAWLLDHEAWAGLSAIGAWVITSGAGVIFGRQNDSQRATTGPVASVQSLFISIAPTVFMVGYLAALACCVHIALGRLTGTDASTSVWRATATPTVYTVRQPGSETGATIANISVEKTAAPTWLASLLTPVVRFEGRYWDVLDLRTSDPDNWRQETVWWLGGGMAGLLLIGILASRRIDINEFSLHHFYKNRLVRCYLGASNAKRRPNRMTGFDPTDDFPLASITPGRGRGPNVHTGPFAIVNATLNLNTGSELAQQERKGTSFTFTPLYSGYHAVASQRDREEEMLRRDSLDSEKGFSATRGFLRTVGYTSADGLHLGTTVAISGAAASPNSGSQTSGPLAFLLTVFDARLGWWLGNPRFGDSVKRLAGPKFAWKYLFDELFGLTTSRTPFVNVSDGGHFENLGLYELVRRRCRYIVIGDAEQDGNLTFEGLGGAVRKCRTDFGVEITLNAEPLRLAGEFSRVHCIVGTIRYPEREEFSDSPTGAHDPTAADSTNAHGWLLYLKSSMTGDEPADVLQYRSAHHEFPHQTTADQFFSESQFESYRRLGLHVVRTALSGCPSGNTVTSYRALEVFQALAQRWSAPLHVPPESASRLADGYTAVLKTLAGRPELQSAAGELLPRIQAATQSSSPVAVNDTPVIVLWLEALQLMQNVFTEFHFEDPANVLSPRNAGWMEVFRGWARSHTLQHEIWPSVRRDYNPAFRRFVDDLIASPPVGSWPASM